MCAFRSCIDYRFYSIAPCAPNQLEWIIDRCFFSLSIFCHSFWPTTNLLATGRIPHTRHRPYNSLFLYLYLSLCALCVCVYDAELCGNIYSTRFPINDFDLFTWRCARLWNPHAQRRLHSLSHWAREKSGGYSSNSDPFVIIVLDWNEFKNNNEGSTEKRKKEIVIEKRAAFFCGALCGKRNEHVEHNRKLIQPLLRLPECVSAAGVCVSLIHSRIDWSSSFVWRRKKTTRKIRSRRKRWEKCFLFDLTSKPFKLTWTDWVWLFPFHSFSPPSSMWTTTSNSVGHFLLSFIFLAVFFVCYSSATWQIY